MRMFPVVMATLFAACLVQVNAAPSGKEKTPDYYPLKLGTKWEYKATAGGKELAISKEIAKIEKIDEETLARLESTVNGDVTATEHLSATKKGVFRHRYNGKETTPPVCVIRYPVKKGDSWKSDTKTGEQEIKMTCTLGEEEIEVPAGKYKTITVVVEGKVGDKEVNTTYWFAEGVGIVKQIIDIDGTKVTLELKKYVAGK